MQLIAAVTGGGGGRGGAVGGNALVKSGSDGDLGKGGGGDGGGLVRSGSEGNISEKDPGFYNRNATNFHILKAVICAGIPSYSRMLSGELNLCLPN